jgi:predicted RNA-binding Zn-ribbon protein involved in translation (DUF1610 family)
MKIGDIRNLIPINAKMIEEIEIDPIRIVENYFFEKPGCKDYRNETINFMIKEKQSFSTTNNCVYDFAKRFVKVTCPSCGIILDGKSGGGTSDNNYIHYKCDNCGLEVSIVTPDNGYSVTFK